MSSGGALKAGGTGRRLLGGSALGVVALLVNVAASLILLPFLIDRLGDAWYGTWVLIGTVSGYFLVLDFGMFAAAERYFSLHFSRGDRREANRLLSTCLVLFAGAGVLALTLLLAATAAVPLFVGPEKAATVQVALAIAAVDVALFFPGGVFNGVLVAQLRYDLAAFLQIAKIVARTLLILAFVAAGHGLVALALITLATNTAERAAKIAVARRLFPEMSLSLRDFDRARAGTYLRFGLWSFLAEVFEKVRFNTDVLVIGAILGPAPVTLYNIAVRLAGYFGQAVASALNVMLPVFTARVGADDQGRLRRDFLLVSKIAVILSVLGAGALMLVAGPFIAVWIGPDYTDAAVPLAALAVALAVEVSQTPAANLLVALNRHRFLARLGGVEAAVNLALSLALIYPLGLVGVALGTAIPVLVARGVVLPVYAARAAGVELRRYVLEVGGLAATSALVQVPVWVMADWLDARSTLPGSLMTAILYVGLLPILMFMCLREPERAVLTRALRR